MKHLESLNMRLKLFEEFTKGKIIYHFTESLDSLSDILSDDALRSGVKTNYGRGYENISFTWNPNLWDIEYMGDQDNTLPKFT